MRTTTRKSKQTKVHKTLKMKTWKNKTKLSVSEKEIFLAHFFFNIIRLETEMGRSLKNFRIIKIQREAPFSHEMKGTSTVC